MKRTREANSEMGFTFSMFLLMQAQEFLKVRSKKKFSFIANSRHQMTVHVQPLLSRLFCAVDKYASK